MATVFWINYTKECSLKEAYSKACALRRALVVSNNMQLQCLFLVLTSIIYNNLLRYSRMAVRYVQNLLTTYIEPLTVVYLLQFNYCLIFKACTYFSLIFKAYRTNVPYSYQYKKGVPYFLVKIEAYCTVLRTVPYCHPCRYLQVLWSTQGICLAELLRKLTVVS